MSTTDDGSDNLYHVFNKMLRERKPTKSRAMLPYLAYLMRGMSKLPPVAHEVVVYRGVPANTRDIVTEHYKVAAVWWLHNMDIHLIPLLVWS